MQVDIYHVISILGGLSATFAADAAKEENKEICAGLLRRAITLNNAIGELCSEFGLNYEEVYRDYLSPETRMP